ncbi:hypothetical protein O9992_25590 [Vibrio lentus]|nr:hypothetical protein [Vibrio lentus]
MGAQNSPTPDELDVEDADAPRRQVQHLDKWVLDAPFPESPEQDIRDNYRELIEGNEELSVAVRSSATAEDLPDASLQANKKPSLT